MIDVKLEDFEKYRKSLLKQASNLLRNRGFNFKSDLVKTLSEDIVQNTYIVFHSHSLNTYVSEDHLNNFLRSVIYKQYQNTVDHNRKGGQYILFKKGEFDQLDVNKYDKVYTSEQFDIISNFKEKLTDLECQTLDYLIDGYSQVEISKELNKHVSTIQERVQIIKNKYIKYESKGN